MKIYATIFNNANTRVTLATLTEKEISYLPFDSVSELVSYTEERLITIPLERCFQGWEKFKAWAFGPAQRQLREVQQ